jgi:hypothetical protein
LVPIRKLTCFSVDETVGAAEFKQQFKKRFILTGHPFNSKEINFYVLLLVSPHPTAVTEVWSTPGM